MNKTVRDKDGIRLKYVDRSCKNCKLYPCFTGIDKCLSDFAQYGCILYKK